jgi:hypothetical protein
MSPGKETIDIATRLLAQSSQADYEELCRLDVLGLEDRPTNSQSVVYDKFKEQLTRDKTERIIESANTSSGNREFYIPHKPVLRTCAESTELRIES